MKHTALFLFLCAGTWLGDGQDLPLGAAAERVKAEHQLATDILPEQDGMPLQYARRRLAECSLTFQSRRADQTFDKGYRLATLQDVTDPVTISLQGVLNDGDVALLVDGWVKFSDNPPQTYTGSNDRDFVLRTKLGIHDCGLDPNRMLQKRDDPALLRRAATITPATDAEADIIRQLIKQAIPKGTDIIDVAKQRTLATFRTFRLDQQSNGVFKHNGVDCIQLAVQRGKNVYASTLVPFKQYVSAGGIRLTLFQSLEQGIVRDFQAPPKSYRGVYSWIIQGVTTIYLVVTVIALAGG